MKHIGLSAIAVAAAVILAPESSAQVYVGAGYNLWQTDADGEDLNLGTLTGRIGYKYNALFGLEGEFSFGASDDSISGLGGVSSETSIDRELGAFAVGYLPVPLFADIFGRVGYADVKVDDQLNFIDQDDGGGLAYGAGLQFNVMLAKLRLEYTRYEPGDFEFDTFGVSGVLQF